MVECVPKYVFLISKNTNKQKNPRILKKQKKLKKKKEYLRKIDQKKN